MIGTLYQLAQRKPLTPFFYAQLDSGSFTYDYAKTQFASAALAEQLVKQKVAKGGYISCNMFNGPEFVFLALAAALSGITLAIFNPRLSDTERTLRKVELENACSEKNIPVLTEPVIKRLLLEGMGMSLRDLAYHEGPLVSPQYFNSLDYAAKCIQEGNQDKGGIIMFTSGSSGVPKATKLSWKNIISSAQAANQALVRPRKGVWQLVLPMCHIGGFQIMVRSLLNQNPFILYSRYQPSRILNDVLSFKVTHISVVDKILQDLLESDHDKIIGQYRCILLGGAGINDKTLKQALRVKARVFASYGMTETSSMIAYAKVNRNFDGGLKLLPGYEVQITQPDSKGIGQLNIKGPSIFEGYLNAREPMTSDKFFVTGDRASLDRYGMLHMYERETDLIISGGENIYPAEVRDELLQIPGVKDAYVFGTPDETWGHRPVAFIEADFSAEAVAKDYRENGLNPQEVGIRAANCAQEYARNIHEYLDGRMSKLHHPKHVFILKEFPRTSVGKVDAQALKRLYDMRIDIKEVNVIRVKQPFNTPIKTAQVEITDRESFFVEVVDWAGRKGIAECVSFATDWYLPETIDEDYEVVKNTLAYIVSHERYLHPAEVSHSLDSFPALDNYYMAKAAIEPAIWDLYGKITGKSLAYLLNEKPEISKLIYETINAQSDSDMQFVGHARLKGAHALQNDVITENDPGEIEGAHHSGAIEVPKTVPGGVVIGIKSVEETLADAARAVESGYKRVKIKISPDSGFEKVEAVRSQYPDLDIVIDANQSFTEEQAADLKRFDVLNIACIEEPLDPTYVPAHGSTDIFARLSALQRALKTPICLDESVKTPSDLERAATYDNLKCYALKIAKFGGIQPSLQFCRWAQATGRQVWMGGMFDTGVSKRMHAAFEALPGITLAGDISDATLYFEKDCAIPPLVLENGELTLNSSGYEAGLGCRLNKNYLETILVEKSTLVK